jgi:hypothetical protein
MMAYPDCHLSQVKVLKLTVVGEIVPILAALMRAG